MDRNLRYPVQMIFVTSTRGDITPLKFRYEDKEHQIITVKVDEVRAHKEMTIGPGGSVIFTCASTIFGMKIIYDLRYEIGTHKWILSGHRDPL
ncbi:MAG: hypothetical protein K6F34_10835 [Lachnospiraceae bacterium]|nr:hypothetical protein [Lachnospiraceae bacterium]